MPEESQPKKSEAGKVAAPKRKAPRPILNEKPTPTPRLLKRSRWNHSQDKKDEITVPSPKKKVKLEGRKGRVIEKEDKEEKEEKEEKPKNKTRKGGPGVKKMIIRGPRAKPRPLAAKSVESIGEDNSKRKEKTTRELEIDLNNMNIDPIELKKGKRMLILSLVSLM